MADPRIVQAMMARAGVSPVLSDPRQFPTPTPEQEALEDPLISPETYGAGSALRKGGALAGMTVFHGSPHRFPPTDRNPLGEFDAAKIGTGEGAQAYGHGLYLAENPKVAESYTQFGNWKARADGRTPPTMFKGKRVQFDENGHAIGNFNSAMSRFLDRVTAKGSYDRAMNEATTALDRMSTQGIFKSEQGLLAQEISAAKANKKHIVGHGNLGNLYKADLPDEQIAKMLDWDATLSGQPESVRAVTDALVERAAKSLPDIRGKDIMGSSLYRALREHKGGDAMGTSDAFMKAGVPGIKYLDAGSLGEGATKTSNFVVFPGSEQLVKILGRE